jgi:hypothetical protein
MRRSMKREAGQVLSTRGRNWWRHLMIGLHPVVCDMHTVLVIDVEF